jgi:hypothetical protein
MADISNPHHWNEFKLESWAKLNGHPFRADHPVKDRETLRKRLIGDWLEIKRAESAKKKVTASEMFGDGKSISEIAVTLQMAESTVSRWRAQADPPWTRRHQLCEPVEPKTPPEAITITRLVTPDEETQLSTELCEVRAEARLMQITDDEWRSLPTKKKKEALEARLLQYAWKTVGDLEKLQGADRLDPNNVKVFTALLTAKEKLYPEPPQPQQQTPGRLHMLVMQGGDEAPPRAKRAQVREIDVDSGEQRALNAANAT